MPPEDDATHERRSLLERALGLFADVHAGEGKTAILLTLNVFLLLLAYYLLKTAREPLILMGGGAEVKSYAAAGQSVLLVAVVRAYSVLAKKYDRLRLVTATTLFFASNLVVFWFLARLHVPLGVAFFLWVGVFNVSIIAQFWSFAADVYSEEQGRRLFAILGIGSSVGAVAGAYVAKALFAPIGPYELMLVAAAILVVCLALTRVVHRREGTEACGRKEAPSAKDAPIGSRDAFALLIRDRYLLLVGALTLLLNWVNTTGEYILDRTLLPIAIHKGGEAAAEQFIGAFKASYFAWVNVVGVVLQLFFVSRILKYLGVRAALFFLPVVAFGGYGLLAIAPALTAIFVTKVAENSLDYSVQNTARQALFLLTTREEKYKAKAAIDTFLVRAGDVLSAGLVALGTWLHFTTRHFVLANVALVVAWLVVVVLLTREHRQRSAVRPDAEPDPSERPARPRPLRPAKA